jgi:CheY-like chemotaxis protein/HAMP domain-containing protein
MKIRTKIILVPALAAVAFLLIFVISTILGSQNNQLLLSIERGYFPALEMSRELEGILETIQRNMQYAASAQDEETLEETKSLRDQFLTLIENNKENPVLIKAEMDSIKKTFSEYYPLALQTTTQMINEGLGDDIIESLNTMQQQYNYIQEKLSAMTAEKKTDMGDSVTEAQNNQQNIIYTIIIVTLLSIILQIVVSVIFTRSITKPLHMIVKASSELSNGNVDVELETDSEDEIGDLAKATSMLVESTKDLTKAADAIGQGQYDVEVNVRSDQDILSNAIVEMKSNLQKMTQENDIQNWLKTGQAELGEKMSGDQSVVKLAQNVIGYVAPYLDAKVGAIFLKDDDDTLKLSGSYAYKTRKNLSNVFKIGEGLVGQTALEKQSIIITDVPEDYVKINSGVGEASPLNILVIPLINDEQVTGVIELGSFQKFSEIHLQFLEQASENIAIAFESALSRKRVKELLEQTQNQAEELQSQQEELKVTNEELQSQQEELRVANEELEEQASNLKKSEEVLKQQQQDLTQSNQELENQTTILKERQQEIETKNTELEITRAEVEKKAKELEISSKYKSEFLANMSHELRTPLNSIQILSRLLSENKESNLNEKQINFAQTINSSGSELLGLINEILDLSKIEAGKMTVNLEKMSLSLLPSYLKQTFEHQTQEKGLYLKTEIDKDLPSDIITDRQRIEQIIKNLLSNALKFTEKGGITVKVSRPVESEELSKIGFDVKKGISISVTDTGIGIPKDKIASIFHAFQQADGTTSRKYGGTGLGLSISRELAQLLKGTLDLQSEVGKGSTFTLYLPESISLDDINKETETVKLEEIKQESKPEHDQEKIKISTPVNEDVVVDEKESAQKVTEKKKVNEIRDDRNDLNEDDKTILVIEDDGNFAKILFEYTREKGFKCLIAEDGEAGLQLANQYKPSAIILDVGLPRIDGWTVMERLKNDVDTRHIPVFFISGHDRKMTAMKMGAIGFLTKPVSMEGLEFAYSKIDKTISKDLKKLLIVEDDETMRESMLELIGNGDVSVATADSGEKALKLLKSNDFDCMILDLGLSDISGFELLEKINKNDKIDEIPIIVYTGKELTKKEESGLRKHAESIIIKGAKSPDRLLDEVSLFLHRVETNLPEEKQAKTNIVHDKSEVYKDKKILLVDDDIRNIFALSSILEEKEMQIIVAENGHEALSALEKNKDVDLVLMDIMMPEMDGYEAMQRIRKQNKFSKLPIIALTAKAMKGDRQKCIDAGANDYLSKPIDVEKMLSLLHVWLYK